MRTSKLMVGAAAVVMVMTLVLGIGFIEGAVGSASPDNNVHNAKARTTLTVLTKTHEIKVLDLGAQGPSHGDLRAINAPL